MAAQRAHLTVELAPRAILVRPELLPRTPLQKPERAGPRRGDLLGIGKRQPRPLLRDRRAKERLARHAHSAGGTDGQLLNQELLGDLVAPVPDPPVEPRPDPGRRVHPLRPRHRSDEERGLASRPPQEKDSLGHRGVHLGAARGATGRRRYEPDASHPQRGRQLGGQLGFPDHAVSGHRGAARLEHQGEKLRKLGAPAVGPTSTHSGPPRRGASGPAPPRPRIASGPREGPCRAFRTRDRGRAPPSPRPRS